MKKFLSLVLSLVMTMSLVTVGAGATEYKDFSDKSEVQYEEAVAVLNKIGIITGYEDGSFKPTGALTRGAAAKIIVSLMIGSEAAANLTVAAAPYKDVPVTNTFAAVISYCKTAGYINGYTDGTFRPTAALTGYAFSKMLLGALGYDGAVEGFTGSGWTMNVAKLGNKAGLFNDFATAFKGNDGVDRQSACLLALNTLKATEVEYVGNTVNVSGENINVSVGNNQYSYVYSNNASINKNIKEGTATSEGYSLEFGEEHFTDLKLVQSSVSDSFGRPSNQWNYKNVKVGTYSKAADLVYTTSASGDTTADKVKDMGIKDYTIAASVNAIVNGKTDATISSVNDIPAFTGKGTQVLLYVSDTTANQITDVVVIRTQIMQVKKVNSDNVTLKTVESQGVTPVNAVEDDDSAYAVLKGLKADDFVVVTPLATTSAGSAYDVDSAYVPQTVTGNISKVSLNSSGDVNGVTVGGTDYKLSYNWTVKDGRSNLGTSSVSSTVESTLYVDNYGFMIYATDVSASSEYIIFDESYSTIVDGRIHYFAQGYDTSGTALSLDFGTSSAVFTGMAAGDVREYTTAGAPDYADYTWATATRATTTTGIAAGAYQYDGKTFASDVKFIFLSGTIGSDITGVTVKDGVQKVSAGINVAYTLDSDGNIDAVIIGGDADVEVSQNIMYVSEVTGQTKDGSKNVSIFTGYIDGNETKGLRANKVVSAGFYTYAEKDGVYTMNSYAPSAASANFVKNSAILEVNDIASKNYITKLDGAAVPAAGEALDARNATVIDLFGDDGVSYTSIKDLAEAAAGSQFEVAIQYNASTTSSRGQVAYIYVLSAATTTTYGLAAAVSTDLTNATGITATPNLTSVAVGDTVTVTVAGTATTTDQVITVKDAAGTTLGTVNSGVVAGAFSATFTFVMAAANAGTMTIA